MTPTARNRESRRLLGPVLAAGLVWCLGFGPLAHAQDALDLFAKPPETPIELWDAIDYLLRIGQGEQAAPLLDQFLATEPDDQTLLDLRDQYGIGTVLRLQDFEATRSQAEPLLQRFNDASRRLARDPERLRQFIPLLTASPPEQSYAMRALRPAGAHAVPLIVEAIQEPGQSAEDRATLIRNLGRLDARAVPALIAVLEAPDAELASEVARILGRLGDPRAVPFLYAVAVGDEADRAPVRSAARGAIARLTGQPFDQQPTSPQQALVDEAMRYFRGDYRFPDETVEVWFWEGDVPTPRAVPVPEARTLLGLKFADRALEVDPNDRAAKVARLSLVLDDAIREVGLDAFPNDEADEAYNAAIESGPEVLGDVLRTAAALGKSNVAAATAKILARVTDRDALRIARPAPLVEALNAPDRRAQFAAARTLVELEPDAPFPGSSRVVPVLARFIAPYAAPRAVVIDGSVRRGNRLASLLRSIGYETDVVTTGREGFLATAASANVEILFIEPTLMQGPWTLDDTLANLRADARTATLPILLVGPRLDDADLRWRHHLGSYPRLAFLVHPSDENSLTRQLERVSERLEVQPLSDAERQAYAQDALTLLARIAEQPIEAFRDDLIEAWPVLQAVMNVSALAPSAALALSEIPNVEAQRRLAEVVVDASRTPEARRSTAVQLARSIERFGPLLSAYQEQQLAHLLNRTTDPELQAALERVVEALRPHPVEAHP